MSLASDIAIDIASVSEKVAGDVECCTAKWLAPEVSDVWLPFVTFSNTNKRKTTQAELSARPKCAADVKDKVQLPNIIKNATMKALLLLEKKLSR